MHGVTKTRTDALLLLLMGVVVLQMIANLGLFLRMTELQGRVLDALQPLQRSKGLATGSKAPSFSLADSEGRPVSLEDVQGSVNQSVLLAFSSTTCPTCQQMYPHLRAFSAKHPEITMLLISRGSSDENRRLVREQGFTFPVLNWQDEVSQAYQVPGTPFFYLIDERDVITAQGSANSLELLEELTRVSK